MASFFTPAALGVLAEVFLRSPGMLIGGGVCAAIALLCGVAARQSMRKQKRLADTETSRIGRLRAGFAEVKGRARPARELVVSPLSKTRCVYFRFHVEEHVQRGKHSYWRTVIDDKRDAGVMVDDGSGAAAVRLDEAELLLKPDIHAKSGTFNDASPELEATMAEYGKSTKGWIFNKSMRYSETLLCEGDELYVIGTAGRRSDGVYEFERAGDLFIVSDESEETLSDRFNTGKLAAIVIGTLLAIAATGLAIGSVFEL